LAKIRPKQKNFLNEILQVQLKLNCDMIYNIQYVADRKISSLNISKICNIEYLYVTIITDKTVITRPNFSRFEYFANFSVPFLNIFHFSILCMLLHYYYMMQIADNSKKSIFNQKLSIHQIQSIIAPKTFDFEGSNCRACIAANGLSEAGNF